jgi:trigger factor
MSTNECNSRNIPLPIQREVRQRCGFGCIICGFPLYEYDHLKSWANVKKHISEEITLLCDKHHREVTSGLLPREKVIEANKSRYNLKVGESKPYTLHFEGNSCSMQIGGNYFTTNYIGQPTESIPLIVDGIPLIGFVLEDGHLLLNLNLFDRFNNIVLKIINNHLFYSINPWDIQLVGKTLIIREKARQFLIRIIFKPPNKIIIDKGKFLSNGVEILIDSDHILVTNNNVLIRGCCATNCHGGLIIGPTPMPIGGFMSLQNIDRYLGDSKASLAWAKSVKKEFNK